MNPTALQILRAALEEIRDSGCIAQMGDQRCECPKTARLYLEAAGKAPGLADDPKLARAVATAISKVRNGHLQAWKNTDLAAAALDSIDTYLRGGAKP